MTKNHISFLDYIKFDKMVDLVYNINVGILYAFLENSKRRRNLCLDLLILLFI